MNCRTFVKKLYGYQDGSLSLQEKEAFEAHQAGCKRCAARLEAESENARMVQAAVEAACDGLEFRASNLKPAPPEQNRVSQLWALPGWRIMAGIASLLILALLLPPIVRQLTPDSDQPRSVALNGDRWAQEITVTYETGLVNETTLISHDSGVDTIIEIQVSYFP